MQRNLEQQEMTYKAAKKRINSLGSYESLELSPVVDAASHCFIDFISKLATSHSHQGCGFVIQRIVWVRFLEEEVKPVDHSIKVQYGAPISSQNVQTHVSLHIDVRVKVLSDTVAFWSFVRVVSWDVYCELVLSTSPETFLFG